MNLFTITDNGHLPFSDISSILEHKEVSEITSTAETGMYVVDNVSRVEPDFTWHYRLDGSWRLGELSFATGSDQIPYQGFISKGVSNLDGTFAKTNNYKLDGSWKLGEKPFISGSDNVIVTISAINRSYTINQLKIGFDTFNNDYSTEFDIEFYSSDFNTIWNYKLDGTWNLGELPFLTKEPVMIEKFEIENNNKNYEFNETVDNVSRIVLIFKKTFNFNRRIRITDIILGITV